MATFASTTKPPMANQMNGNGVTEDDLFDPSPDIHGLFVQFNQMYFLCQLGSVELAWSKRMTLCAGVCQYYGTRSGRCSIRLSQPLLQYRPRSDLIDTLLHEMIHAFLFVTHNNTDRDGHGPMFQEHMLRINKQAGTNITIYHTFRDEVNVHRKHIWRCDGVCRTKAPFFGYVRRANNRAPGPYDFWFAQHKATCNGTFIKESEPEGYKSKKRKSEAAQKNSREESVKKAKIFTINGAVKSSNIEIKKPGVKSDSVVPFSCNGFVLGSGQSQSATTPIAAKQSKLGTKARSIGNTSTKKKDTKMESPLKQTSLADHFANITNSDSKFDHTRKIKLRENIKDSSTVQDGKEDDIVVLSTDSDDEILVSAIEMSFTEVGPSTAGQTISARNEDDNNDLMKVDCPCCGAKIESAIINNHLDTCLS